MAGAPTDFSTSLCKICYENSNQRLCTIPCGHISHESCLKRWFQEERANNRKMRCPECRKETKLDAIIPLFGTVPTSSSTNSSSSRADIRREICERSRLLNPPPEEISTPPQMSIRQRFWNRLRMRCTHEDYSNCRKVYSALAIELLLGLGLLMLMTFHDDSKKFICEHYIIIMFTICFICGVICHIAIPGLFDEMESVVGGGSILYLSALAICNLWSLDPCGTTMYPFRILTLAIGLTTFIAIILTTIAFKMRLDLTGQREALFGSLFFLIISIIVCSIVWYFSGRNLVVWFSLQSLCLFVCCLYLMMFTQLMKELTYVHTKQYIFLSMGLYASIVNMVIFILKIFGEAKIF